MSWLGQTQARRRASDERKLDFPFLPIAERWGTEAALLHHAYALARREFRAALLAFHQPGSTAGQGFPVQTREGIQNVRNVGSAITARQNKPAPRCRGGHELRESRFGINHPSATDEVTRLTASPAGALFGT
jgi:hypothetical protein